MSEKFKQLKLKYMLAALLKSVVCGVSFGLLVVGIVLLSLKLSAISLAVVWYILIGVGAALLCCGITFIFFMPTNKKVAARLDNEFELDERVQTTLEYSDQDGTIVRLQREDTDDKLKTLPKAKFKLAGVWQFCLIAVISLGIAFTAIFIPAKEAGADGSGIQEEPNAVITNFQIQTIQDMHGYVLESELKTDVKTLVAEELEALLNIIAVDGKPNNNLKVSQLMTALYATIDNTELIINNSLTYIQIANALNSIGVEALGKAILAGGNSYRAYSIVTYDNFSSFNDIKDTATSNKTSVGVNALKAELSVPIEEGLAQVMQTLGMNIVFYLADYVDDEIVKTDSIYTSVTYFGQQIFRLSQDVGEDDAAVQKDLGTYFQNLTNVIDLELSEQSYAGAMRRYIGNQIKEVFGLGGLEQAEPDDEEGENNEEQDPVDSGNPNGGGGIGDGELEVGTDDKIYNPADSKWQELDKDLLAEYQAMLGSCLEDGTITQEQYDMAIKFFAWLYGKDK